MVEEGEKMGGVYTVWYAVLHAVQFSTICFLQRIEQLQDQLARNRRRGRRQRRRRLQLRQRRESKSGRLKSNMPGM